MEESNNPAPVGDFLCISFAKCLASSLGAQIQPASFFIETCPVFFIRLVPGPEVEPEAQPVFLLRLGASFF